MAYPKLPHNEGQHVHAEDILGPNLGSLKGKMTRKTQERVILDSLDNLPNELLVEHGKCHHSN